MRTALAAASLLLAAAPLCFAPPKAPDIIKPKLTKLTETRMLDVVPQDDNTFSFEKPQLECKLELPLPAGYKVAEIIQPELFTATDSDGNNIAMPEKVDGFSVSKVELDHVWEDDDAQTMTIKLLPPARTATTFTLNTKFNAVIYAGTKNIPVTVTNSETPLPDNVFATTEPITAVLADEGDQSTITFKPGAVRGLIESISVNGEESNGSMWNDTFVTYYLPSKVDASTECTIAVRQGAASVPVLISIKNHPLP